MTNTILHRILKKTGNMELLEHLDGLPMSDLNSLLLEVFRRKSARLPVKQVIDSFRSNRFVTPSSLDPVSFLEMELSVLRHAQSAGFLPQELSPLAPLGSCSVVGLADQNKIVSALRGTEVLADATNVLAIQAAVQRKASGFDMTIIHTCATSRHVRAQSFSGKGFSAHFKVFCAVSSGKDSGSHHFEKETLIHHLLMYRDYFLNILQRKDTQFVIKVLHDNDQEMVWFESIRNDIQAALGDMTLVFEDVPAEEHNYYSGIRFSINLAHNGSTLNIGDGGFVDWAAKLTGNHKERMLTSGIGTELLYKLLHNMI